MRHWLLVCLTCLGDCYCLGLPCFAGCGECVYGWFIACMVLVVVLLTLGINLCGFWLLSDSLR